MNKNQHDSDSPNTHPPTLKDDDGGNTDSTRKTGDDRTGALLRRHGIGAWKKLQEELQGVPYELIERRVNTLIDEGKKQGIIVHSLRTIPFTSGTMDEAGPLPAARDYWQAYGFSFDDDNEQRIERSDPELAEYFKECGI